MPVAAAYLLIILIWSTTPLAIQWSGISVGHEFGVLSRMVLGFAILFLWMRIRHIHFPMSRHAIKVYLASGLSLFFTMAVVYWAAQYIPSGWISVIFGISPMMTGVLCLLILQENNFTYSRTIGMLLGVAGLTVMFYEGMELSTAAWLGIAGIVFATIAQPAGAVVLKKLKPDMHAIAITSGSLIVAIPLFTLSWLISGSGWPTDISDKTLYAIIYLAIAGTGVGFPLYYFLLKHISAGHVSLITLITPVTALYIGYFLNGEALTGRVWAGTFMILAGLVLYENHNFIKLIKSRKNFTNRFRQH